MGWFQASSLRHDLWSQEMAVWAQGGWLWGLGGRMSVARPTPAITSPSVAVCPSSSPARSAAAASGGTSCRCSQPHATALPCYIMAENVQLWSGPVGRGHPTAACSFLVAFDHIFSRESIRVTLLQGSSRLLVFQFRAEGSSHSCGKKGQYPVFFLGHLKLED